MTTQQLSAENLSVIAHNQVRVITTELLAQLYGASSKNITDNFANNIDRFVVGKHYFKLEGEQLKAFKSYPENIGLAHKFAKHLILWTERGAARHAKMLDTDQAWDVFEKLEDCYFNKEQKAPAPTTDPHWQIADTVDELVKQGVANKRTLYNRLYRRFSVDSYKKIPVEQCQAAVDYLKRMATTSPQQEPISLNDGEWYLVVKDGVVLWEKLLKPHCNDIPKNVIKNPKLMLEHIREVVGEFIGKEALPAPQPQLAISYPVRAAKPPKGSSGSMGNQHYFRATDFVDGRFDPIRDFLDDLERAGYEVAGLKIINIAKTWIIKEQHQDLAHLNQLSSRFLSQLGDFHQQQKNIATKGMNVCWLNPDIMQIVQKYQ